MASGELWQGLAFWTFAVVACSSTELGSLETGNHLCPSLSFHVKPPLLWFWPFSQSLLWLTLCCPPPGAERTLAVPAAAGRGAEPDPGQRPRSAEVPQVRDGRGWHGGAGHSWVRADGDGWLLSMVVLLHLVGALSQ